MATIEDIALTITSGVGIRTTTRLIEFFGSAVAVFSAPAEYLETLGINRATAQAIASGSKLQMAYGIAEKCSRSSIRILAKGDLHYPTLLSECVDAPYILYVRGDIDFNQGKWMAVVGTRNATQRGMAATQKLVSDFAESYPDGVVVSGLAFGIDKAAHLAAMDSGIATVAVMAGWVDDIVPSAHFYIAKRILDSGGAVVSDMPPDTVINKGSFLSRNRVIAGLSHLTVVTESASRGGSLVTADIAVSYDREVMAMAGQSDEPNYEGTNRLIKSNKALLYQNISDIAQTMGWERANTINSQQTDNLPDNLAQVFRLMPDTEPVTLDEISQLSDISIASASSAMMHLEIRGLIKSIRGRLYQKSKF